MSKLNKNSSIEDIRAYIDDIMKKPSNDISKKSDNIDLEINNIEEFDKLKTKVLKYIVYKKRTEKEVRTKFSSSDVDQNLLDDVIENLKENGYINDENYIQRAVNEFLAINTLSLKEIRNKLYAKGISSDIIDTYFSIHKDELEEYELNSAKKLAVKKQNQMDKEELEAFLYRKGYSRENIKQVFEWGEKYNAERTNFRNK